MIEPNQNHVARLLRRKSSFEEYQCRLVDKIKRHFEGRRRQWDKNIANWMRSRGTVGQLGVEEEEPEEEEPEQSVSVSEQDEQTTIDMVTSHTVTSAPSASSVETSSLPRHIAEHPARWSAQPSLTCLSTSASGSSQKQQGADQISILSMETTHFPDEERTKHTILVDIQSFIKFGSVTVRQEVQGLTLIGQFDSQCNNCRSRQRRELARTYEKLVDLDAAIESDSMLVHTTREGIMRIDVVTSLSMTS